MAASAQTDLIAAMPVSLREENNKGTEQPGLHAGLVDLDPVRPPKRRMNAIMASTAKR